MLERESNEETQKALDELDLCQVEIYRLDEKESEAIVKVREKSKKLLNHYFKKRNEIIKRIPKFWATAMVNHPQISLLIDQDVKISLNFLDKVEVEDVGGIGTRGHKINFFFKQNHFFENQVLEKQISYGNAGDQLVTSSEIKWKDNMCSSVLSNMKCGIERKTFYSWLNDHGDPSFDQISWIMANEFWQNPLKYYLVPSLQSDNRNKTSLSETKTMRFNTKGSRLDKPKTDKHNEHGEHNGLRYGLSSMQGWRFKMEDAHCAVVALPEPLKEWSFFAVFDGHGGERVSSHCAENLLDIIIGTERFTRCALEEASSIDEIKTGIRDGFLLLDDKMRTIPEIASGEDQSGSTAVCVMISPSHMYIANCGDSRGVICRDSRVLFSTQDHKPFNPAEKERIVNAGGFVVKERVNGRIAVSRALGDYRFKNVEGKDQREQLVSPEPEVSVELRNEKEDEFIILACDGVWDVMTNEDLAEFVCSRLRVASDLQSICNQVIDTCLYKGSRDNMSIVLVAFPACPSPQEDAIQKEAALEELLKKRVKELVNKSEGAIELPHVLQTLSDENISDLPPGGGLAAKGTFIDNVYKSLCPSNADTNEIKLN